MDGSDNELTSVNERFLSFIKLRTKVTALTSSTKSNLSMCDPKFINNSAETHINNVFHSEQNIDQRLEIALNGFICLYYNSSASSLYNVVKRHQNLVVSIIHRQLYNQAFSHLSVIQKAIISASKRQTFSIEMNHKLELMAGIPFLNHGSIEMSKLVIAFHFLSLQNLLKMLAHNIKLINLGEYELFDMEFLRSIPSIFLSCGNFIRWIEQHSTIHDDAARKNITNILTIIKGLLHVFHRLTNLNLDLPKSQLKLKLAEYEYKKNGELAVDFEVSEVNQHLQPYYDDLMEVIPKQQLISNIDIKTDQIKDYSDMEMMSFLKDSEHNLEASQILQKILSTPTVNIVHNHLFLMEYQAQAMKLPNETVTLLDTCIIKQFSSNIAGPAVLSKLQLALLDSLLSRTKTLLQGKIHLEVIKQNMESLYAVYDKFKDDKRIRTLSNIAFNLAQTYNKKAVDCMTMAIEYEFKVFKIDQSASNLAFLENKITKGCSFLVANGDYSTSLFKIYHFLVIIQQQGDDDEDIVELNFKKMIATLAEIIEKKPALAVRLFGQESKLTDSFKAILAINILKIIQNSKQQYSNVLDYLINTIQIDDDFTRAKYVYHCYNLSGLGDYPSFDKELNCTGIVLLYASGIEILKNAQVEWNLGSIQESMLAFETYVKSESMTTATELEVAKIIAEYLAYNGLNRFLELFILKYLQLRNLGEDPDELRLKLDFVTMLAAAHLKLGHFDNAELMLKTSASLMSSLNKRSFISSRDLLNWKISQVHYYLCIDDIQNASEKLKGTLTFIQSKPEFSLAKSTSSLSTKLFNLLGVAQANLITSEFHQKSRNFVTSYQCARKGLKLALSLMKSMTINSLGRDFLLLKWQSAGMVSAFLRIIIQCLLELGISRDLVYFLSELDKVNEANIFPYMNAINHFFMADAYALILYEKDSEFHFKKGSEIESLNIDDNSSLLKLCSQILQPTCFLSQMDDLVYQQEQTASLIEQKDNYQLKLPLKSIIGRSCYNLCVLRNIVKQLKFSGEYARILEVKQRLQHIMNTIKEKPLFSDVENSVLAISSNSHSDHHEQIAMQLSNLVATKQQLQSISDVYVHSATIMRDINQQVQQVYLVLGAFGRISNTFDLYCLDDFTRSLLHKNDSLIRETHSDFNNSIYPNLKALRPIGLDFNNFEDNINSVLPTNWSIITLDISPDGGSLVVSKYNKEMAMPLYVKLPFNRMSDHLDGETIFSFNDAIKELNDIIEASNASIKPEATSIINTKEDRKTWWRLRFSLDLRMQELLAKIENRWFGAFKGIFNRGISNYSIKEFSNFIGEVLNIKNFDIDEELLWILSQVPYAESLQMAEDAIYFILDSLVYAGNEISYDEINFDGFKDKMQKFFGEQQFSNINDHIILIPGSQCCKIPWESLPMLEHKSISRVPSIDKLIEMLKQRNDMRFSSQGLYLINPGGDLTKTETRFKETFQTLIDWEGIIGEKPSNPESFLRSIMKKQIFVYIGHGGCEEYIKPSVLFKIANNEQPLPPSLLIGCSSGSLETYGVLNPHGNVYNWLNCGSPMIIANLWDVTDKDIDQFTMSVFKLSSLLGHSNGAGVDFSNSLRDSRKACNLKYLNGSAPVVYGLPLHI